MRNTLTILLHTTMKRTLITITLAGILGLYPVYSQTHYYDDIEETRNETLDTHNLEMTYDKADEETDHAMRALENKLNKKKATPCIYDMPYSLSGNYPNYHRLAANTAVLFGGGITALVVLDLLPSDATNWNKSDETKVSMTERYYRNVMDGPHWDGDNPIFNYILHPYAGAAYFMSARSQGFNFWYSALYSFAISTFFWEYGIEAFMEIPSWQDLIITPVGGAIVGELFYKAKRYIVEHDYRLLGWKPLGYIAAFLCDPVNEFLGYFRGNNAHGWSQRHKLDINSQFSLQPDGFGSQTPTLAVSLTF